MCAVLTKGYSFGASETVTNAKLHSLVDSATISGITGTEITDGTITSAKFGDIEGSKLVNLDEITAGAGIISEANGGTGASSADFIKLTADQTAAGVKTFSSGIILGADSSAGNKQITGLCIENRTNDTGCTQTGRIWLRTDA